MARFMARFIARRSTLRPLAVMALAVAGMGCGELHAGAPQAESDRVHAATKAGGCHQPKHLVIGRPDQLGAKGAMLLRYGAAIESAGFRTPPRVWIGADVVRRVAELARNPESDNLYETQILQALRQLETQTNERLTESRPWVIRPSDWDRGRNEPVHTVMVDDLEPERVWPSIVALCQSIVEHFREEHPFARTYGHIPGVVVEPLIAHRIPATVPHERDSDDWAPDWSGAAYAERPGPDWGTYAIVGAGLAGATVGGVGVYEGGALMSNDPATDVAPLPYVTFRTLRAPTQPSTVPVPDTRSLLTPLWPKLAALHRAMRQPVYVEWVLDRGDFWLTQLGLVHEDDASPMQSGVPVLRSTENVLGSGTHTVERIVWVQSSQALTDYHYRFFDEGMPNPFAEIGNTPHVLIIPTMLWSALALPRARDHRHPAQGRLAVVEIRTSAHARPFVDHVDSEFLAAGGLAALFAPTTGTLDWNEFDPQAKTVYDRMFELGVSADGSTDFHIQTGQWVVQAHQASGQFDILRVGD
jgi:hypothetical protein